MKRPKILHITNWFPSKNDPKKALWIRDQIDLVGEFADNEIWHIEVIYATKPRLSQVDESTHSALILEFPTNKWFVIELLTFALLTYTLVSKTKIRSFTHIHFHIAYPLLTYWHLIRYWVKKPILVSEHWSAYHFNFNVERPEKLRRIKKIFRNPIRLITVSNSLANDIIKFSNQSSLDYRIVPNVIDFDIFRYADLSIERDTFFMISQWKDPKDPYTILRTMKSIPNIRLRIGGYGPQLKKMESFIAAFDLKDRITLLGVLNKKEIATELNHAVAFIHSSFYETFSVVCAEALGCGCPVIASAVGGIPEFVKPEFGILVNDQTIENWKEALQKFHPSSFDRKSISTNFQERFRKQSIIRSLIDAYNF